MVHQECLTGFKVAVMWIVERAGSVDGLELTTHEHSHPSPEKA